MNLKALKYFVAVAEYGHFGQAATACFVSQPTLSMQLKKLENELGVMLFERNNKRVLLTPVGEVLLKQAKLTLQQAEQFQELARSEKNPLGGRLRLGVIPTIAPYLLPLITVDITQQYPDLTLLLEEHQTEVLLKLVQEGELDAAVLALPLAKLPIIQLRLYCEDFMLAVPDKHLLAEQSSVSLKDLKHQPLLLLEEGHCLRDQTLAFCKLMAVQERQDFRATSLETLRQMVAAHVGITVMPKLATNTVTAGVCYLPFAAPSPYREVVLICRDTFSRMGLLKGVQQIIQQHVLARRAL